MKTGHTQKLPNEYKVVLMEGNKEVGVTYAANHAEADKIISGWKNGTYKLLID